MATTAHSLSAWGDYDRDNPLPLFERVRQLGTVHEVTLADGHDACIGNGVAPVPLALNSLLHRFPQLRLAVPIEQLRRLGGP
jgi:hypothetical protein